MCTHFLLNRLKYLYGRKIVNTTLWKGRLLIFIYFFPTAQNESEDTLCQLDEKQRFRLCGLIFNSEYFDGKVTVPASYSITGRSKCSRNVVSFRRDDVKATVGGKIFSEWMIVCYMSSLPIEYDTEYDKIYHLSQAYGDSENATRSKDIFIYRHGESDDSYDLHYYLVNLFTNVRF